MIVKTQPIPSLNLVATSLQLLSVLIMSFQLIETRVPLTNELRSVESSAQKRPPKKPNWFLALQFDNAGIQSKLQMVQDTIVQRQPELEPACTSIAKSHVTLFTFHVKHDTLEHVVRSVACGLHEFRNDAKQKMPERKYFTMAAKGVSDFK